VPVSPAPRTSRAPQARVLRNQQRLIDAAMEAADQDGWSGLNFANVSARAGLSRRPLQDRFADSSHLAAAAWGTVAEPALQRALEDLLTAGGQLGEPISVPDLTAAFEVLMRPNATLRAATELLLVSQFDLVLRSAVRQGLGAQVEQWCQPQARVVSRVDTGRRGYLLVQGLGLLIAGRRPGIEDLDIRHEVKALAAAIEQPARPTALPKPRARHLDEKTPFDTGDPTLDALLQSVLDQVGADGFDRASVERIVAAAGTSQGALFGRYATKLDLFIDATRRQQAIALRANHEYIAGIAARHGAGIADAVTLREFQRPGREALRAHLLEQIRISWHEPGLMAAHALELETFARESFNAEAPRTRRQLPAFFHFGYALGLGAPALAVLYPGCWTLPYDVVTVPLLG
jgi:AcrR family transcriptional regulator